MTGMGRIGTALAAMAAWTSAFAAPAAALQDPPTGVWETTGTDFNGGSRNYATDGTYIYTFSSSVHRRYDPQANTVTDLPLIPTYVSNSTGAGTATSLFSFGSVVPPPIPNTPPPPSYPIYQFDIAAKTWTLLVPTWEQTWSCATAIGTKIYLTGGTNAGAYCTTVAEFDTATKALVARAPLPAALGYHAAAAANGKLYVFGGSTNIDGTLTLLSGVYEFDPATNKWTTKTDITVAGQACPLRLTAAFSLAGRCYVTGGQGKDASDAWYVSNQCLEYNPVNDMWVRRADLAAPRAIHLGLAIGGLGYAAGGTVKTVEAYTPPEFGSAPAGASIEQRDAAGILPQGGTASGAITFAAHVTDPDAGQKVLFDVQVRPADATSWIGVAVQTSGLKNQGDLTVEYSAQDPGAFDWRWRVRDDINNATPWTEFSAATPDFFVAPPPSPGSSGGGGGGRGGCSAGSGGSGWALLATVIVTLVLTAVRRSP